MPVSFEIHPTIGIARIGASDGFFIGPEPGEPPPASYRDEGGILRQAARFRIFRVEREATGRILAADELTPGDAEIVWTVHLANRKATSFKMTGPPARRNAATGVDATDKALIIDPGPRSVSATVTRAFFDSGSFRGTPVPLGEARFEAATGRLIVLGGKGLSELVPPGDTSGLKDFADNDGWFDDTSEGPITATVRLKATGEQPKVSGARVVVAPPDYAPDIQNFVTVYDIVYQTALDKGLLPRPATFSFVRFVHPILMRASGYQWVNAAGFAGHGGPARRNFAAMMNRLADPQQSVGARQGIFRRLRDPRSADNPPTAMPLMFAEEGYREEKFRALALTPIQYEAMGKWATVPETPPDFVWDSPNDPWAGQSVPDALDRVALEACAGGPFYPGIEVPRFIGDVRNYEPTLPVRLREDLAAGIVNAASAVPWQADFYLCRWEGSKDAATGLESFERAEKDYGWWPAQRPDSVFTDESLEKRVAWDQDVPSMDAMVFAWKRQPFVLRSTNNQGAKVYVREKLDS